MKRLSGLQNYLHEIPSQSSDKKYFHRLIKEKNGYQSDFRNELQKIVNLAHEDAIQHLRSLAGITLDPLCVNPINDPAQNYPECLHIQTLKGYFGEIFSGIVAETYPHFGENDWEVPAFLFRFHQVIFEQIESMHQTGDKAEKRPGRTGDDNIAFHRDDSGNITKSLICEAKCTHGHDSHMILDAYDKISETNKLPVSLWQLVEILKEKDDPESNQWVDALRKLWFSNPVSTSYERCDLVVYVCGRSPANPSQTSWVSTQKPHPKYTGGRRFEFVEVHLNKVDEYVYDVYGKKP